MIPTFLLQIIALCVTLTLVRVCWVELDTFHLKPFVAWKMPAVIMGLAMNLILSGFLIVTLL
jgi:hypothetical protein